MIHHSGGSVRFIRLDEEESECERVKTNYYRVKFLDINLKVNGPPVDVRSLKLNIPCPGCHTPNKVSLDQVAQEELISCIGCGVSIRLIDQDKGINNLQNGFNRLQRKLNQLGHKLNQLGRYV